MQSVMAQRFEIYTAWDKKIGSREFRIKRIIPQRIPISPDKPQSEEFTCVVNRKMDSSNVEDGQILRHKKLDLTPRWGGIYTAYSKRSE